MERNESTHEPEDYYSNLPDTLDTAYVIAVDPMLATGGSATYALNHLKAHGATQLAFACLVAAPEGAERLADVHADVPVVTAALDRELDANAFIRPGLGDAGDRLYGT
jgi:uracil phosphoribosyltransferase